MTIDFKADGKLDVLHPLSIGQKWYFKPGPAHLDTCEFFVQSKLDADLVLKYIGFIDRGQRIESRYDTPTSLHPCNHHVSIYWYIAKILQVTHSHDGASHFDPEGRDPR